MKNIAVVFGGYSFEHEISIVSAISMKKILKNKLIFIFIDKNREFYLIPSDIIKSNIFSSGDYKKYDKIDIVKNGFIKRSLFGTKQIDFDIVLNLTHGGDGEDGVLASLFKFFNIPFIGPRVFACAVSFDKNITKSYATSCGIKTLDFKHYKFGDKIENILYPCIIKPCKLGSSIGISIVNSSNELDYALDVAFEFDDQIIIEPFINGVKEYNLAGVKIDNKFIFSIIEEPQKEQFLDFDKKYLDFSRTASVNKADISKELEENLKDNFTKIYNTTFEGAIIRCDFFVIENNVYLNEINPIPGSMANYLFDDFNFIIENISNSLPQEKYIPINYEYVTKIQNAKGKAC